MGTGRPDSDSPRGSLLERSVPGGRTMLWGLALLVPLSSSALVGLDARESGAVDLFLVGAAALFTCVSGVVAHRGVRRLRELAAVAEAVRTSSLPGVSPTELRVSERFGATAASWNLLLSSKLAAGTFERRGASMGRRDGEVLGALSDGVVVLDQDMKVVQSNPAASALAGSDGAFEVGGLLDSCGLDGLAEPVRRVFAGGPVQRWTMTAGTEESPQVLRVRAARFGRGADRVLLTLTDVTRQSVAEASRGGFLARATHELRAPLTNLKLYTDQAIEEGDDPELRQEALNVIGREVLRLDRTVSDLLRISELETGGLRAAESDVHVDQLLRESLRAFTAAAEQKAISLELDAPPKLPVLRGDRDHIELVIQNLVGNAIKYTRDGGKVTLRADADEREFTLEVIDSGIGIAAEECGLVFDKFYRAGDERVQHETGSGLGLALAREIARQHGGDVTLQSELDSGSTFTLRVPITTAA